jgi:hypothetical protein
MHAVTHSTTNYYYYNYNYNMHIYICIQVGVKFSGFAPKIQAMETLLYMTIDKVITLPKPADADARRAALRVVRSFREQAHKLQSDLARSFPFVGEADLLRSAKAASPKSSLSKLNSMVKSIGRNVKASAAVAYERIGASVPGKVMDDELVYYAQLVSEVCGKCQVFDDWLLHLQAARSSSSTNSDSPLAEGDTPASESSDAVAGVDSDIEELLLELHLIADFMREALLEIVLRDVETLLDRYLRKMRKSFVRMHWDLDDEL